MHKNDRVLFLEQKIIDARNEYYNSGAGLVSDDVYDLWVDELKKIDPENLIVMQVGAEPVSEWIKEKLPTPMLSLDKVQNPEQFKTWFNKYDTNQAIIVMDKLDGLSICCEYKAGKFVRALTRGGHEAIGENISSNVIRMQGVKSNLPNSFTGFLRGEILLTKNNHKKYFADYSNPRNAASGVSRRYDGEGSEYLSVYFYKVVSDDTEFETMVDMLLFIKDTLGLQIPYFELFTAPADADVISYWNDYQEKLREELSYEIDGLVCAYNNIEYQVSLGGNSHHEFGATAFKFIPEVKETILLDVEWQNGNSSRITPVAILKPVSIAGSTVQRASLHNCANIERLGLTVGAKVAIVKRNEIIPYVEAALSKTDQEIIIPKTCPACGAAVEMSGEYLTCPNLLLCPAQRCGRIQNWCNTLNLLEWGVAIVNNAVEFGGVKTVPDLYKLTIEDLEKLPRMGTRSATRAYDILHANKEISLERFLGGLSIPMIGKTIIGLIAEAGYNSVDKIMAMSISNFENISGIGSVKAKLLYDGLIANKEIIKELFAVGIKIKEKTMGKLNGMTFVFTGTATHSRDELTELVVNNGGSVKSSVGKTLSYLVCEDESTTKYAKAKKYGVKIISEQEFFDLID